MFDPAIEFFMWSMLGYLFMVLVGAYAMEMHLHDKGEK